MLQAHTFTIAAHGIHQSASLAKYLPHGMPQHMLTTLSKRRALLFWRRERVTFWRRAMLPPVSSVSLLHSPISLLWIQEKAQFYVVR